MPGNIDVIPRGQRTALNDIRLLFEANGEYIIAVLWFRIGVLKILILQTVIVGFMFYMHILLTVRSCIG